MRLTESVKPISYLKSHTAEAVRTVTEGRQPIVITQHSKAKAVLQHIAAYEQTQQSLWRCSRCWPKARRAWPRVAASPSSRRLPMYVGRSGKGPSEAVPRTDHRGC
jgi:prevent-host-death family protein